MIRRQKIVIASVLFLLTSAGGAQQPAKGTDDSPHMGAVRSGA